MKIKSLFSVLSFLLIFSAKAYGIPYKGNYIYRYGEDYFYLSGQPGTYVGEMTEGSVVKALISNSCGILVIKGAGIISYSDEQEWSPNGAGVDSVSHLPIKNPPACNNGILSENLTPNQYGDARFKDSNGNIYLPNKEPNKAYKVIYYKKVRKSVTFNKCGFAVLKKPKSISGTAYWWLDFSQITVNGKTYIGEEASFVSSPPLCKNGVGYVPVEWLSN
ncbi:MAG: hypothetical protein HXY43_06610 [Fischerella sp.]|uniref:hypothetical protein n=1 Tax=Fischerella sp. TaxID=1191 RepID=UPI0017BE94EF|nr:hypothetical protein [Fischerella sp.]NWF58973.1 hypothetical protein [Fischerella sp.]